MATRGFSMGGEVSAPERNIDKDAPQGMRQEILDIAFSIAEHNSDVRLTPDLIYRVVSQRSESLLPETHTVASVMQPVGTSVGAPWPRAYDIILRLAREFDQERFSDFQHEI